MAIEEAGGYCDFCQRPVLGRRQGINNVVYALFSLFSCGLFLIVWAIAAVAHQGDSYACPTCGGRIRGHAAGPLPPAVQGAAQVLPAEPRKPFPPALGLALGGLFVIAAAIALVSNYYADKREATPLVFPSPSVPPKPVAVTHEAVLTDSKEYQTERIATFHRILSEQSRQCGEIASARMKRRGAYSVWTVTCSPAKAYVFEYDAKASLVGLSTVQP